MTKAPVFPIDDWSSKKARGRGRSLTTLPTSSNFKRAVLPRSIDVFFSLRYRR
jgi:hypothetical protein